MRRELPARASLEHLKKQAKDLQDAHRRADPEALARIRDAVPAFAAMSDAALAAAPFALHDAQSAIAREYGLPSWAELRDAVARQGEGAGPSDVARESYAEALLRALMPLPFPPKVGGLLRDAAGKRTLAAAAAEAPLAAALPLVALRNALFVPRAIGPIHVSRPSTREAIAAGLSRMPPTVAVFAQRNADDEAPDAAALHPVGSEAYLHAVEPDDAGKVWLVLEGVRWIRLASLVESPGGAREARVRPMVVEPGDPAVVAPLAESLRARAKDLASAFPEGARLVALLEAADPERLGDMIVANMPVSVDEKARYAAEPRLEERLRTAIEMADRRVSAPPAGTPG